jgi:phytol kinase
LNPAVPISAILGAFGLLVLGVRGLQSAGAIGAETGRKLVHMGVGGISLCVPWVFSDPWPVWLLVLPAVAALIAVRLIPRATHALGGSLYEVGRFSLGEVFYPLGVAIAFTLARHDHAAYCGGVAVLGFADSAGALVGAHWGRHRYSVGGHWKSIEGSAAVFIVAVACTTAALACFGRQSWTSALPGGLLLGAASLVIEGAAGRGLDNLLLPVAIAGLSMLWTGERADLSRVRTECAATVAAAFAAFAILAWASVRRRADPPP